MQTLEILILSLLFCGTLPIILPRVKAIRINAVGTVSILLLILLYTQVNLNYFTSFVFGNFTQAMGIEHGFDSISFFMLSLIAGIGMFTSYSTLRHIESIYTKYTSCFVTIAIASSLILSISRDIFNFYIFFELCNICFYLILSSTPNVQKKKFVLEYLLLGGVASVFIVLAIEIIYVVFGSLNVTTIQLNPIVLAGNHLTLMKISTLFLIVSAFIKLGIFPFNIWVKKIYTTVPNFFLPFYGSIASSLMLYLVIFFLYRVIGSYDIILFTSKIITPFCLATVVIFSIIAIKEKDLRTIFAYSTLAQSAYVLVAITTPNVSAISGGILHIVHNIVCKFGLFVIICQVYHTAKTYNISTISHIAKNKIMAICFCILCAGLIGLPLTSGFVTKFYMIQGLIEEKRFAVVGFFIVGSILSIVYFWKIIQQIYFTKQHSHSKTSSHAPQASINTQVAIKFSTTSEVAVIISAVICVFFGIFTHFTLAKSQILATIFLQNLS